MQFIFNLFEPWNNSKLAKRDVVINEILQCANAFLLPTKRETREIKLSVVLPLEDRWSLIHENVFNYFIIVHQERHDLGLNHGCCDMTNDSS